MHGIEIKQELWVIKDHQLLILAIAERIQRMAVSEGVKPSRILRNLNIEVPKKSDSWEYFNYTKNHFLDYSCLNISSDTEGLDIQISDILNFFDGAKYLLQKISSKQLSSWPYLFCAQLQIFCEIQSISPKTAMCLFALVYSGNKSISWDILGWKYLLNTEKIIVGLDSQINTYDNNAHS
tara:strand:- start:327 stop:866 length:540 start_codon:yes stop_codon:yes gene_type:complete